MKKSAIRQYVSHLAIVGAWAFAWSGCTTTPIAPLPVLPPHPPDYVQVPHPQGLDIGDLMAIFTDRDAPSPDLIKACDSDFSKLRTLTQSKDELAQGARELVRAEPVRYHWCFYGKLLALEEGLKSDTYLDERQKRVLDTYQFLGPIARAYMDEFHDSRYLRWAIARYKRISEFVFFRKVDLAPQMTSELTENENPFGLVRPPADPARGGILNKYGLNVEHGPALVTDPVATGAGSKYPATEVAPNRAPASSEAAPQASASVDGALLMDPDEPSTGK